MFATLPDALRLFVVPVFAWAALRDVRTRRLPNRLWPPLYAFGALLLIWETARLWPLAGLDGRLFLVQAAISLLFVAPLGYAFWYLGAFGGADAKALIAIAVLFPTFPEYAVAGAELPLVETQIGVFSLTVLTNTVLLALAYPLALAGINLVRGERSATMFLARPVATDSLPDRHGRLFEDDAGTTRNGLDLDALRMYLRWRGLTLADLRANPDRLRDPDSVGETHDPTDGGTHVGPRTDGGVVTGGGGEGDADRSGADHPDGPWAAERFLEEIDHGAYGTDAETLRGGLAVVARKDRVLVSPGMPFVVPMAVGLIVSLTFGDALFAVLGVVGLV
ncbi:A24 family peptidase [Halorubrum amylolyticum]|uniref:A24 family peptidase n=1 Tax=Halorubrum amylolyticum TaxID=2508724 RepID=UPI001008C1DE|nr:A24 family peptidase [Halorubrum amylolyticum]